MHILKLCGTYNIVCQTVQWHTICSTCGGVGGGVEVRVCRRGESSVFSTRRSTENTELVRWGWEGGRLGRRCWNTPEYHKNCICMYVCTYTQYTQTHTCTYVHVHMNT